MKLLEVYDCLLRTYGPQGWWPLVSRAGLDGRDAEGYLPGSYDSHSLGEAFEIAVGAVLTQNTSWKNASRALRNLLRSGELTPERIVSADPEVISAAILPSGCHRVKAKKLLELSRCFLELGRKEEVGVEPTRRLFLSVWGIGPESADSILLYAFGMPVPVLDAYTRRILERLGLIEKNAPYEAVRRRLFRNLPSRADVLNEFHAVLVAHAKSRCKVVPDCASCVLGGYCHYRMYASV